MFPTHHSYIIIIVKSYSYSCSRTHPIIHVHVHICVCVYLWESAPMFVLRACYNMWYIPSCPACPWVLVGLVHHQSQGVQLVPQCHVHLWNQVAQGDLVRRGWRGGGIMTPSFELAGCYVHLGIFLSSLTSKPEGCLTIRHYPQTNTEKEVHIAWIQTVIYHMI